MSKNRKRGICHFVYILAVIRMMNVFLTNLRLRGFSHADLPQYDLCQLILFWFHLFTWMFIWISSMILANTQIDRVCNAFYFLSSHDDISITHVVWMLFWFWSLSDGLVDWSIINFELIGRYQNVFLPWYSDGNFFGWWVYGSE